MGGSIIQTPFNYKISENIQSAKLLMSLFGFVLASLFYETPDFSTTTMLNTLQNNTWTVSVPIVIYSLKTLFTVLLNKDMTVTISKEGYTLNNGLYANSKKWNQYTSWHRTSKNDIGVAKIYLRSKNRGLSQLIHRGDLLYVSKDMETKFKVFTFLEDTLGPEKYT